MPNLDAPRNYLAEAVKTFADSGIPVVRLADFACTDAATQKTIVEKAGGDWKLFSALVAEGQNPVEALHKTLCLAGEAAPVAEEK